jgi:transposase
MAKRTSYSAEVRERAVRMVYEQAPAHPSQWAAICSIAEKIGCTPETLRKWTRRAETDAGQRPGPTTDEREEIRRLKREVKELKRTNEILRKASAFFAQAELDRKPRQW